MITTNYPKKGNRAIDFARIRELNPLVEYCENQGIDLRRSSNRWIGKCPLHNEIKGTAFVIHPDEKWQCYGKCRRQGDVIDLEVELHGGTIAEAARRLDPNASGNRQTCRIPPAPEKPKLVPTKENPLALPYVLSEAEIRDCHRFTVQLLADRSYIDQIGKHRQWKPQTICAIAFDGHLGRDDNRRICFITPAGCKSRWRQDGERRFKFLFGKSWLWRGELIPQAQTVYLCEGETDAITLVDCGLEDDGGTAVIGIQGATFNIQPWAFLFDGKEVIISTDYDEAGRKAGAKIENALSDVATSIGYLNLEIAKEVSGARA